MKRIIGVALFAVMVALVLAGCTQKEPAEDQTFAGKWNPNMIGRQLTLRPVAIASSAGALTLTPGSFFVISGTETITSIATSAADAGRIIIFLESGACSFTDGSNLKMAGNITLGANDVIGFIGDGTNWTELFRAVN